MLTTGQVNMALVALIHIYYVSRVHSSIDFFNLFFQKKILRENK